MLNKVWRRIKSIIYALPYAFKGGEILTTSNKDTSGLGTTIQQEVNSNRLSSDLLKGEVTQQVEELRYRDYRVSQESKNYKYLGNGIAVKEKESSSFNGKVKFTQENKLICESVLDGLKQADGEDMTEKYVLNIEYQDYPRFKLEKYCTRFTTQITPKEAQITLYFNREANANEVTSKQFTNALNSIFDTFTLKRTLTHPISIEFVTQGLENEKDYVKYFLSGLEIKVVEIDEHEFAITYIAKNFLREDLTEKFLSKSMKKKYDEHTPKEKRDFVIQPSKVYLTCEQCGKKVEEEYGLASKEVNGRILCLKCWQKTLQNE